MKLSINIAFIWVCLSLSACHGPAGIKTTLLFTSASYLNPDIDGNASPVVINIYELKTPFEFKQATYNQLNSNAASILAAHLLDKQTYEIRPGDQQTLSQYVASGTHYIGITASYRNIDQANWREVLIVPPGASSVTINLSLQSQGLIASLQH